MMSSHIRRQF